MLILKVLRTDSRAQLPEYATNGAACFDLHCVADRPVTLFPGDSVILKTGLKFEVPDNHVMQVFSRSGHGFKHGIRLANCTGIIDSDYRGEVCVKLYNDGSNTYTVVPGERVAQAMLVKIPSVAIVEGKELSESARGENGYGSTGK